MSNKVRFGLIGAGSVAKVHAKALHNLEDGQLVSISTRNKRKGEFFVKEFNCDYYTDYRELLEKSDIDVVCVTLPSGLHADIGIEAAKFGKHVVVEKPIDITLKKADALINECERQHVQLSVIFQRRFSDAIIKLKKSIEKDNFGQLNFGAAHTKWYRSQDYFNDSNWHGTWQLDGGGALINQSIHYVDLLRYTMGEIDEVFAFSATRTHDIEVEDILTGTVKFKNGALGLIEANTAAYPGLYTRLDVYGEKGLVVIVDEKIDTWKTDQYTFERKESEKQISGQSSPEIDYYLHQRQLKNIIESILENKKPMVTGIDARNTLSVVLALYESSRTKRPQKVDII
ncbi:Gfo/Idh/MocA family protein [Petrotoga halophila]|uniref:Oxidoreductase n=1 Tax=Petrotoga halophila DSM 16923 TaxID=1122953 RepID=A0A2S5EA14_9BACT|nr:Gfo/Idh/MocA family oxidoreductase [Petrotoga halophila]POZ89974.1 hypothetical protein AA81_11985 [Petrotoga halophila DSM 16923]